GFIDKKGKLVIPMKFEFVSNGKSFDNSMFKNGVFADKNIGVISRTGDLLLPKDGISSIEYCENEHATVVYSGLQSFVFKDGKKVVEMKGSPVINPILKKMLSIDGKYVSEDELASKGYSPFTGEIRKGAKYMPLFCSNEADGFDGYIMCKDGKYGVIDNNGVTVFPFVFNDHFIAYGHGFFLHHNVFIIVEEEIYGYASYPISIDVYRNGELLHRGVSFSEKMVSGHNFLFIEGVPKYQDNMYKQELGIDLPSSVFETFMIDEGGNRISRTQYGNNFLNYDEKENLWTLEDNEGRPVLDMKFSIFEYLGNNIYSISDQGQYNLWFLNEKGDTINVESLQINATEYLKRGALSFDDLKVKKYKSLYNDGYYNELLSKEDNLLNISCSKSFHKKGRRTIFREVPESNLMKRVEVEYKKDAYGLYSSDGKLILPENFDEIGYFSEGLLLVKFNGRWFFTNSKGEVLPYGAFEEMNK
ncbi:MAG: WG repeat-containing protein, partial [Paludibacteraceae bacterium]|nr:WG repeat-containing protein [Paludibacteraceae bacterium]